MELNESAIIKSCQKGKLEDFGRLYDAYAKKIYQFIYFKTQHKETAEDLTSQTFIKALENINNYREQEGARFSSWLYRIARNKVIDHYRTKKENLRLEDIWEVSDEADLEFDIDVRERLSEIKKYLLQLTKEQREIVIMRVWDELSYQEIAEIIGKNEAACKMAFSRAIKKIREDNFMGIILLILAKNILLNNQF